VPILLVWIYVSWVVVLMGAVIAAYLPSLLAGVSRRGNAHGWLFQLAIEVLQQLNQARTTLRKGVSAAQLAERLQVDVLQLEPVLETLVALDWVGQLNDEEVDAESRYLLLVDPDATLLAPLIQQLLLGQAKPLENLWEKARWRALRLRDAL
jgi:membrane protein